MSTTTIRIADDLKARTPNLRRARGPSAHALIIEVIAEKADSSKRRMEFMDSANTRMAGIARAGETVHWTDMRANLKARVSEQDVEQLEARRFVGANGNN